MIWINISLVVSLDLYYYSFVVVFSENQRRFNKQGQHISMGHIRVQMSEQ
jgi:hypothetical protein